MAGAGQPPQASTWPQTTPINLVRLMISPIWPRAGTKIEIQRRPVAPAARDQGRQPDLLMTAGVITNFVHISFNPATAALLMITTLWRPLPSSGGRSHGRTTDK
jgi:hypothetical protein